MTNTEIKELIEILKKEGCNSKKQAIEYLEGKLLKDRKEREDMKLKKELVDELIRITKVYFRTGETDILPELIKVKNEIIQKYGEFIIYYVISLIEDLAMFAQRTGKGTNEDIYRALEVFGVIVEW